MTKNLFLILTLFTLPLQANTVEVMLDNGMKIIIREDHRAPVVASQVWYRIGSTYEYDGITGVSHVLEHMMFKGTKNYKSGDFTNIIKENGGSLNAFTSKDFTGYHERIASDRLEICLELEADRMRNVIFLQDEFEKELAVVQEERRWRTDNKPKSKLLEQFYATAFLSSPERIPTVGWMGDLEDMEMQDASDWYQKWYAPNNATLVVVGDVDSKEVIQLAEKYFAKLKPSDIKPPKSRPEIKQNGERRIKFFGQTASPYMIMGFKTPVLPGNQTKAKAKDIYALDVLGAILDGGSSARIAKNILRGKEIAVSAGTSYDPFGRLPGLFIFAGTPNKGIEPQQLETAFMAEIKDLQENPVSKKELDRVKAQVIASKVFEQDSMFYTGMQLGILDSVGLDWRLLDSYVDDIRQITAEDVQRVASQYFDSTQLTVATLWPETESK